MRFKIVPGLFLIRDRKVLLLERTNCGTWDGYWCPVSGSIEFGESPKQTAIREAFEEVGVVVHDCEFSNFAMRMSDNMHAERSAYYFPNVYFFAHEWEGEPFNKEPHKHGQVKWFDLDALPANTQPIVRSGIEAYLNGQKYGEYPETHEMFMKTLSR